ncbi:MAG: hypothetical protein BGO01_00065 [Armatimonadetes bacterium 55-13]|nr:PAS domain S-box protein [Armatimonadota bacterium]OJU63095.1 MAG: hypothetical protein BGO01_00065 [Armatimonadetes bacterium 55-13]
MVALAIATASGLGFLIYSGMERAMLPTALGRLEARSHELASRLQNFGQEISADVATMRGAQSVDGLVRAIEGDGFDVRDGNTEEQWRQRLEQNLYALMRAKPRYLQFRLIGKDRGGREIVRLDRSGPDDTIRIVPPSDLQPKGDRPYFKQAIGLQAGEFYTSPIELNQERGQIEVPYVPVIRVATPVRTASGKPFGILIANVDMRAILGRLKNAVQEGSLYLVDSRGSYLIHPDPSKEFGYDLGKPTHWKTDFSEVSEILSAQDETLSGSRKVKGEDVYSFASVLNIGDQRFAIIESLPYSQVMAPAESVRRSSLGFALIAALIATGLATLIARSTVVPIEKLTQAVEKFDGETLAPVPIFGAGEVAKLANAFNEMTEDVRGKTLVLREIGETRQLYSAMFENSSDAMIVCDLENVITAWSPGAERMFGYTSDEVVGQSLDIIIPDEGRAPLAVSLRKVYRGESLEPFEVVRITKSGKRLDISLTIAPILDEDGKVIYTSRVLRDVTDQKKLAERFRQAQKMEAVGNLAGGIAHDFNNILTAISGTVKLALQDLPPDSPVYADLKEIEKASARGTAVVGQILKIGREGDVEHRLINLDSVVSEVAQLFKTTAPSNVEIIKQIDPDLPAVMGDENEIHQIVMNLGVNALHAMREKGGRLEIRLESVRLDDVGVRTLPNLKPGRFVCLSVSDTGHGMTRQTLEHIFEPFFTTKSSGEGTGLGLSVVYGMIQQHRGAITAYSEVGRGSMFRIYLPAAGVALVENDQTIVETREGRGERIMYVDDDEALVLMIGRMLKRLNYDAVCFQDARQALKAFEDNPNEFDVVVSDLSMPLLDGPELVRKIKEIRPSVPVIMVTGYIRKEDLEHAENLGIHRLILKPNTVQEMGEVLHEILSKFRRRRSRA